MKGKETTYEEKLNIVQDYLNNNLSYRETAEKFQVSYNNVYAWVNKYKKHGPDGLIDSRGGSKPTAILTDKERLNVENKALKARNEYLEMENDALKKLQEVERELMLAKQGSKQSIKRLKNFTKKKLTK